MPPLKIGDRVKISDRDMTLADVKSGQYYDYFRNLTGTVESIYDDNTACINIEMESLPEGVLDNHRSIEGSVRTRWINGLGVEQKEKMREADKQIALRYNILVNVADLSLAGKVKTTAAGKPKDAAPAEKPVKQESHRQTQDEIEKAEEDYLKSIAAKAKDEN
ncbi:MAG: hypothetical protein ABFD46_10535 [Armatimonadota bacterium]